jgi:hypothetical protein
VTGTACSTALAPATCCRCAVPAVKHWSARWDRQARHGASTRTCRAGDRATAARAGRATAIGYGATFLGVPAAITALIRSATPPGQWTSTLATFTVIFAAGQICGPYLAGALADRYGTGATLIWAAALCAAGAALSAVSRAKGH